MGAVNEWWSIYYQHASVCSEIGCEPPRIPWEHPAWGPAVPEVQEAQEGQGESWDDIGGMLDDADEEVLGSPEDSAQLGLDPYQERVVLHREGPAVVMAGAGSGKTRTVVARVEAMIEQGIEPSLLLCLTFTKKAANEMKQRVTKAVGARAKHLHVSTFHSLALDLLRAYPSMGRREAGFTVWAEDTQKSEMRNLILNHDNAVANKNEQGVEEKTEEEVEGEVKKVAKEKRILWISPESILGAIEKGKEECEDIVDPQYHNRLLAIHVDAPLIAQQYEELKRDCNALDFADMVWTLVKLLLPHPEVGRSIRDRWNYIIVDEYQDTNRVQERMLAHLVQDHQNLMVVGDEDQAIYSFRGSNVHFIRTFGETYPTAVTYLLGRNYRSTANIVEPANALISHNQLRTWKRVWSEGEEGSPVILNRYPQAYAEAKGIVNAMLELHDEGVAFEDMAVLVRTRSQFIALEMQLTQEDIPYFKVGDRAWYTRHDARTVLAWMRAALNERDLDAGATVMQSWPRLGASTVKKWREGVVRHTGPMLNGITWLHGQRGLGKSTHAGKCLERFIATWVEWSRETKSTTRSLRARVADLVDALGIYTEIATNRISTNTQIVREADARKDFVNVLLGGLPDEQGSGSWDGMRKYLDAVMTQSSRGDEVEGVCLTTIHSAKGLEWPFVWTPGWCEQKFPSRRALTHEDYEEERRLAYVAITRAKRQLTVSWFNESRDANKVEIHFPSPFLKEMDPLSAKGPEYTLNLPAPPTLPQVQPRTTVDATDGDYAPFMVNSRDFQRKDTCNGESASFNLTTTSSRIVVEVRRFPFGGHKDRCRACNRQVKIAVVCYNTETGGKGQLGQHCAARALGHRGMWFDALKYAHARGLPVINMDEAQDGRGKFVVQSQPTGDKT
jgi:DNA helicase-2/ATP-dependent DNA helicase PcrA